MTTKRSAIVDYVRDEWQQRFGNDPKKLKMAYYIDDSSPAEPVSIVTNALPMAKEETPQDMIIPSKTAKQLPSVKSNQNLANQSAFTMDNKGYLEVYTDGGKKEYSCGTVLSSIGVYFRNGNPNNVSQIVDWVNDNNVAEASAILAALTIASKEHIKKVRIYTDSKRCIDVLNSPKVWAIYKNNGKLVRNNSKKGTKLYLMASETFNNIFHYIKTFEEVQMIHVKRCRNTEADQLASEALDLDAAKKGLRTKYALKKRPLSSHARTL